MEQGYVIRCVDHISGSVLYRGNKNTYSAEKDALAMGDTYTYSGAKKALANMQRMYPDEFYSVERLSCCYLRLGNKRNSDAERERVFQEIDQAMIRLDELWDGNEFDRGDKMRINKAKSVLRDVKEYLLRDSDADSE